MDLIKDGKKLILDVAPKIFTGILIIIVTYIIAKIIQYGVSNLKIKGIDTKSAQSSGSQKILLETFSKIIFWIVFLYGFIIALKSFGVDISSLIVILGSAGLAIALALQGTITEIAAGFMIMLLNYYDIGDLVSVQIGGDTTMGKIENFDLFTTTIQDPDRRNHRLPNTTIVKSHLINYYKNKEISVGFELSISNNNDIDINTLINSLRQTVELDMNQFITNKDMIDILVYDISASGTKLYVRIPIESINYVPAKFAGQKIIREFCGKNGLRLLDNHYSSVKGGSQYYS
jgi:small conductance mechanosensitive channel